MIENAENITILLTALRNLENILQKPIKFKLCTHDDYALKYRPANITSFHHVTQRCCTKIVRQNVCPKHHKDSNNLCGGVNCTLHRPRLCSD